MCGIVGIGQARSSGNRGGSAPQAHARCAAPPGPDGEGLWIDGPVGLAMRRLAIVDVAGATSRWQRGRDRVDRLQRRNLQPRRSPSRARAARSRLPDPERHRDGSSLVRGGGERCVERLQGMFAFALWTGHDGSSFWRGTGSGSSRSTTPTPTTRCSSLRRSRRSWPEAPPVRPERDDPSRVLATDSSPGRRPSSAGCASSCRGERSRGRPDRLRERRYWRLASTIDDAPVTLEERAREVRARLTGAVRSHLMSDVPLGLFLSGGIDSSGLAALMAPMVKEPIRTFAVGFSDPEANELAYARLAARAVGAEHREVVVAPRVLRHLPNLVCMRTSRSRFPRACRSTSSRAWRGARQGRAHRRRGR